MAETRHRLALGKNPMKPWESPWGTIRHLESLGAVLSVEVLRDILPPYAETRLLRISRCPGLDPVIRKALEFWKADIIAAVNENNLPDTRFPLLWRNPDMRQSHGVWDIPIDGNPEDPVMFRWVYPDKLEPVP